MGALETGPAKQRQLCGCPSSSTLPPPNDVAFYTGARA